MSRSVLFPGRTAQRDPVPRRRGALELGQQLLLVAGRRWCSRGRRQVGVEGVRRIEDGRLTGVLRGRPAGARCPGPPRGPRCALRPGVWHGPVELVLLRVREVNKRRIGLPSLNCRRRRSSCAPRWQHAKVTCSSSQRSSTTSGWHNRPPILDFRGVPAPVPSMMVVNPTTMESRWLVRDAVKSHPRLWQPVHTPPNSTG